MMNETRIPRILPERSSGSGHTFSTPRHTSVVDPILSKRVCFYKSGDPQFNGLRMVINNRTFKTFDALLDSLSKKVPLPFGVRNITTPRGIHAVYSLDELEDGKSYICSDYSKVKPINLALTKKKMPPWYHARPVSSQRRTAQQAQLYSGRNALKQEPVVVRTPKRLLVFRNGDPSVRRTVILRKRTTPTFQFILEYISELMQYQVVKLYTADGRHVDSLPGLILCSGTVVAAGKEPFKAANYTAHTTQFPTWLPTNRMGLRRLKPANRKSALYTARARHFSPSSERYIVNQIHDSLAESSCDHHSNPANSVELESSHIIDSLAETEGDTGLCDGAERQDCVLPTDDDIEKSFRVNQDGSISVEMRVRLTIKEEETIHWMTTLTRASVANHIDATSLPESEPKQEVSLPKPNPLDAANPDGSIDITKNGFNNDNPPSLENGLDSESSKEEDKIKTQMDVMSPRTALTPGPRQVRTKQASVESITSETADRIQEGVVGSYAYKEQTEDGALTEYCMVKQSNTKPVPKPRRFGSEDVSSINSINVSTFQTAGMTEIQQTESSGEEVTETVLQIYELQTFQDNFLSNICAQGVPNSEVPPGGPPTLDMAHFYNNEFETKPGKAPTALESTCVWGGENLSVTWDVTTKTGAIQATSAQAKTATLTKSKEKPSQREVSKDKKRSSKGTKKGAYRILSPGKTPKEPPNNTRKHKKMKPFSSAGFIKRIYGNKSKSAKSITKVTKTAQNKNMGVPTQSLQLPGDIIKCTIKDPNTPTPLTHYISDTFPLETPLRQPRGLLTRQTSMHQDNKNEKESYYVHNTLSQPAFKSSSFVTHEYVAKWLKNTHLDPAINTDEESKKSEPVAHRETDRTMSVESESNHSLNTMAQEGKCFEEKSEIPTCPTVKGDPMAENLLGTLIKQRIQSFENQLVSSNPLTEKTTVSQQHVHNHTSVLNTENNKEKKLFSNGASSQINPLICNFLKEIPPESPQTAKLSNTCSLVNPPPGAPLSAENIGGEMEQSNTEHSASSSPLYRLSSMSSPTTDTNTLTCSATTDWTISTTDHNSIPSTPNRAPIPRTSSIKRTPLVSNLSLERKMSLRKACVDKYALSSDATLEKDTSSLPVNTAVENMLSNSSTGLQRPNETLTENNHHSESNLDLKSSPSCCTSASPTSLTSKDRASTISISSTEASISSELPFNKVKIIETQPHVPALTDASSPKPLAKHVKRISTPSPERKSPIKKSFPEKAKLQNNSAKSSPSLPHNHHVDTIASRSTGMQKRTAPNASPSTNRKQVPQKPHLQTKLSPYSQSIDMVSPPQRHKSNTKLLSRNISSDSAPELTNKTQKKSSPRKKTTSMKPKAELDKTLHGEKCTQVTDDIKNVQGKSVIETQPLPTTNQPSTNPVLHKICFSIKSIRQISQSKRPNSVPDFSSHVASTFGSSSKALLAFLSVMTIKDIIINFNMYEMNIANASCAEALKMIDSLREIAGIEESQKLKLSLANLQQSASKELLQSWKSFQELCDTKYRDQHSTPNYSEQPLGIEAGPPQDCGIDEYVDEIMDKLDIPETLKEELASLSVSIESESIDDEQMTTKEIDDANTDHFFIDDALNITDATQHGQTNESFIIKTFTDITQSNICETEGQTEQKTEEDNCQFCPKVGAKYLISEESTSDPGKQLTHDELSTDEEVQNMSSANMMTCKASISSSEQHERHMSEEQDECESREYDCMDKEDKKPSTKHYVDLAVSTKDSLQSGNIDNKFLSEEEQSEGEYEGHVAACSTPACLPNSKIQRETQTVSTRQNLSGEESARNSDVDEPVNLETDRPETECKKLKMIAEECLSGTEQENMEEQREPHDDQQNHDQQVCENTPKDDKFNTKEENNQGGITPVWKVQKESRNLSNLAENQVPVTIKDDSGFIIQSDTLAKHYGFDVDEDSGNDHSNCEEQAEAMQSKVQVDQVNCSTGEEKESSSEEVCVARYREQSFSSYRGTQASSKLPKDIKHERALEKVTHQPEEQIQQSVAERVSLLEIQVAEAQRSTTIRRVSQRRAHLVSDVEDSSSDSHTSQSALHTRSAPQSSLSFSYDSNGVVTTEPGGNRVRSIREMFLSKSAADVQGGQRRLPSPNTSESRAETSASGGYQSQTSSELSSGEDDSSRKPISKGFVRRTIERLYGKKDPQSDEDARQSSSSEPKHNKKEDSLMSRSKATSELSYFSSSNALSTLTEVTRCIPFNAQVGPGESVCADEGKWIPKDNALIKKSISDPVGINKTLSPQHEHEMCEDTEENPHIHFSVESLTWKMRPNHVQQSAPTFSLPHTSDSDLCQDEASAVNVERVEETIDKEKMQAEKNSTLPRIGVTDFKMLDNKVHPLIEGPADGEVVLVQPGKSQGVVDRRVQEPDVLDLLYNFCGQNCPIL